MQHGVYFVDSLLLPVFVWFSFHVYTHPIFTTGLAERPVTYYLRDGSCLSSKYLFLHSHDSRSASVQGCQRWSESQGWLRLSVRTAACCIVLRCPCWQTEDSLGSDNTRSKTFLYLFLMNILISVMKEEEEEEKERKKERNRKKNDKRVVLKLVRYSFRFRMYLW